MSRILSERFATWLVAATLAFAGAWPRPLMSQEATGPAPNRAVTIVSSEILISRGEASIQLELGDGRTVSIATRDGGAWIGQQRIGDAPRGEALDRAWRELLNQAMDTPTDELDELFGAWRAPGGETGERFAEALREALAAAGPPPALAEASAGVSQGAWDSIARLHERIQGLEARLSEADGKEHSVTVRVGRSETRGRGWTRPFRRIWEGLAEIFSLLLTFTVLVGLGFAVVFFGRRYLENVADTARHQTVRSGLVGLAASFLILPVWILGMIALAISIVGIPALLAWIPLYPVAVMLAAVFGFLGVAHAMGEALAERRFRGEEWLTRANSYYYVLTGTALLFALYVASSVVHMAGPWFGFIRGTLLFFAIVLTGFTATIGFGAVLISRGGTRRQVTRTREEKLDLDGVFEEESRV